MPRPTLIAAMSRNRVIGFNNSIPWKEPEDMKFFKATTTGHPVIMGRKTWESLGRWAPLPGRINIVISRTMPGRDDAVVTREYQDALVLAELKAPGVIPFVIGGAEIYKLALPGADRILLTEINREIEGDTFFPELGPEWKRTIRRAFYNESSGFDPEHHRLAFDTYERV